MTISIRVLRARGSQAVYTDMAQIDPLRYGVFRTGRGDTSVDAARRSACATSAPADGRGWCACRSGVACSLFILNFAAWGPRVEDVLAVAGQHLLEGPIVAGSSRLKRRGGRGWGRRMSGAREAGRSGRGRWAYPNHLSTQGSIAE